MLVSAKEMMQKAKAGKYAVGQFNINNLEWTKAILLTAQENNSPVILGVSEGAGKYMGGYKTVVGMVNGMLEELNITVPVALHLDHGSYEGALKVIEAGFSSVMFDGSHYGIEENIEKTKDIIARANAKGMSVEAEVGSIGGEEDGVVGAGEVADPAECKRIAELGVDILADAWAGISQSEHFFGQQTCIDDIVSYQRLMQAEGYKAMFEEARRQKPFCSMAFNWCYNHPWKVAAGGSLLLYPHRPTKAYYAVTDALRPVLASARISKFAWAEGETFHAQLWLLNDAPTPVEDTISAYLELDGQEQFLLDWHTGVVPENTNQLGPELNAVLPAGAANTFRLILRSQHGYGNSYTLCYRKREPIPEKKGLNM